MVVFSSLKRSAVNLGLIRSFCNASIAKKFQQNALQIRQMSGGHEHEHFKIEPSRFQWNKFKDMLHFYIMLGAIPIFAIVMYCNIFIGPATLTETPEDYVPKHWEYHRHPISRFLARYVYPSPQQDYEKMLHSLYEESERVKLRALEAEVKAKMAERHDYQAYYYRPAIAKYHRVSKEAADHLESIRGDI